MHFLCVLKVMSVFKCLKDRGQTFVCALKLVSNKKIKSTEDTYHKKCVV